MSDSPAPPEQVNASPSLEQDSWNRLRSIIDSLADGIVIVDKRGDIRFANPAAERLFNRSADELLGTPFGSPLLAGETTEMEIVRRGGGDVVYAELRVVDADWEGETAELVSLRDITDRKRAEEHGRQLSAEREARLEAEAASQAKSDFLAIMSHELRTPLNAILGYSELMELGISGDLNDVVRKQVARIRISAKHLLGLVNDILDLAKVETGKLAVSSAPADVSEAIASALTLVKPQAAVKNLAISTGPISADLPRYIGDEERVRQILVNLLSNAVKSTEPGGSITVDAGINRKVDERARLQRGKAYVSIRVIDTGLGIEEDKLDAIFEPFVQADSGPTRSQEGSGLGLTIGRRLARAMGGDLTVESKMGKGSTFMLLLPADVATEDRAPAAAAGTSPDAPRNDAMDTRVVGAPLKGRALDGLGSVGEIVLSQVGAIVDAVVARIRTDANLSMGAGVRSSQIADHLSTFLADIAGALAVVEESRGRPSPLLADAMEIQRLISERHGTQRARLGWTESSIRREFMILREELGRVVRVSVPSGAPLSIDDAISAVNRFVDQAEYVSVRALERERNS